MSYVFSSVIFLLGKSKIVGPKLTRIIIKRTHGSWRNNRLNLFKTKLLQERGIHISNCCVSCTRETMTSSNIIFFKGKTDRYNGVMVDSEIEKCDIQEFSEKLEGSLKSWIENGKRVIWFKVSLNETEWVPVLAKNGFKFHHAKEDYVMMLRWLSVSEINNVPHFAHTMMGVGAVVINDSNQLLVVRERYYPANMAHFKLPGGYVEPGENIVDAAIREVQEETNIKTQFQSLLGFRHTHKRTYGCSDVYIVVHLKALTNDIKKCDREILECKWMDITEYFNHPDVHDLNKFIVRKYVDYEKRGIKINCFHGFTEVVNRTYTLYSVTNRDFSQEEVDISKL